MEIHAVMDSWYFAWVILPLLIFSARILDVSLGTIRIVFVSRGIKYLAPLVGFFEVFIWLIAVAQIFNNLTNPVYYVAYAGGFAAGTYAGMFLETKLSIGTEIVRIITQKEGELLLSVLNNKGYIVTSADGQGARGPVKIIYVVSERKRVREVIRTVKKYNPSAFYTIEDVRSFSSDPKVKPKPPKHPRDFSVYSMQKKSK